MFIPHMSLAFYTFTNVQVFNSYTLLIEIVDGINDITKNVTFLLGIGLLADYCLNTVEFFNHPDKLNSNLAMLYPVVILSVMMIAASTTRKVHIY